MLRCSASRFRRIITDIYNTFVDSDINVSLDGGYLEKFESLITFFIRKVSYTKSTYINHSIKLQSVIIYSENEKEPIRYRTL